MQRRQRDATNTSFQEFDTIYPGLERPQDENDAEIKLSDQCYRQNIDNHDLLAPAEFSAYYDRLDLIRLRSRDCQTSRRSVSCLLLLRSNLRDCGWKGAYGRL